MAIDRRGDRLDNTFTDPLIARKVADFPLILLSQPERGENVLFLIYVIGLDNSRENGEPILGIEGGIKVIAIDTCNFL